MPIVTVSMYPGRSQEQKDEFAKAITKSAVEILKAKENHVIVVFEDNPKENWYQAGNQL
ncbi:MAG: tautomerase family protein [Thaumarchaeota archaeon]|nr:tautomerase family protein [Nitrososphaerota archaeon]